MTSRLLLIVLGAGALIGMASARADETDGLIVLYRGSSILGAAVGCPIRHEGKEVVELGRGKYASWPVKAGRYILTNKTSSIEVNVAAGETRYVRCIVKAGFMSGRADLQIVDKASFDAVQSDLEPKSTAP